MKHKALGKGLRSLIPEAPRPTQQPDGAARSDVVDRTDRRAAPVQSYPQIDIDQIVPSPDQPREEFDETALEALADSLKRDGVLQPVLVRPLGTGGYALVAGERRWRAAQRAGLLRIPAVIKDIPENRQLEFALVENLQREDLNAIEEARAYRTLVETLGLTQQQVGERIGKPRATIANTMRLLALPEAVQKLVRSGDLSMGHARALLSLGLPSDQIAVAERAVKDGLSVREVEAQVARALRSRSLAVTAIQAAPASAKDPNVTAAEETLQRAIGTKVRILQGRKGGGRLELHFFTAEELDRVYNLLLHAARDR